MTQIILHGGYRGDWEGSGQDMPLFAKLVAAAEQADGRVLVSFLAQETPTDFPHLQALKDSFKQLNPSIELVIAGTNNFLAELPKHQVLFVQGGNSGRQQARLAHISKAQLLQNKTVIAGSSSGAMALCQYGFSRSSGGVFCGKGMVDVALMPHAGVWPVADFLPQLQAATTLPILLLPETHMAEFVVVLNHH
jgi:hypothetical protein